MEPFISMICVWPLDWAPRKWANCWGQLLQISQNSTLYALIGNTYGGNGTTDFALPDLRGRVPIGYGHGPNLTSYGLGQIGGYEMINLSVNQVPAHPVKASAVGGTETVPGENNATTIAASSAGRATASNIYNDQTPTVTLNTGSQGSSQPHENRQPFLAVNYIIALDGLFPSRN